MMNESALPGVANNGLYYDVSCKPSAQLKLVDHRVTYLPIDYRIKCLPIKNRFRNEDGVIAFPEGTLRHGRSPSFSTWVPHDGMIVVKGGGRSWLEKCRDKTRRRKKNGKPAVRFFFFGSSHQLETFAQVLPLLPQLGR